MKRGTLMGRKPAIETPPTTDAPSSTVAPAAPTQARPAKAKTREGKRNVTAFIDEAAHRQLRLLAAAEDAAMQDLFVEALNLLFENRSLSRIA
jgi:protein-disulfide isomerase